jgi:NAD dependent epimerase/dehydratase family enzyme
MYVFAIEKELDGSYNALAGYDSNYDLMKGLAQTLRKPYWLPNVPGFVMRRLFGEMALMLLNGVRASNEKIKETGFVFKFTNLKEALSDLLKK